MTYSVAIRTLGTAGEKYVRLIHSLEAQTISAKEIIVYIAEGYPLPLQVGREKYIRCPKGMVHQRSLSYDEIDTEFILLCDDDILLQPDSVERMFIGLQKLQGDAISANVYFNHKWSFKEKVIEAMYHAICPSWMSKYAYRIRRSSYLSYNMHPKEIMETQCFSGACILAKKSALLDVSFQDERWMDLCRYTLNDDQLLAYKLYRYGYKVLMHSDTGIEHLDAQTGHETDKFKEFYAAQFLQYVIWFRSVYEPDSVVEKVLDILCFYCRWGFRFVLAVLSHVLGKNPQSDKDCIFALKEGREFVHSQKYASLPKWVVKR